MPGCSNPRLRRRIHLERQIHARGLKSTPGGSNPRLERQIHAWRFKSRPGGSYPRLEAQIHAWRLKSTPVGSNPRLEVQPNLDVYVDELQDLSASTRTLSDLR